MKMPVISELLATDAGKKLAKAAETVSALQQGLYAFATREDRQQSDLQRIGTVLQIFFIDTLAAGKKPGDLTEEDWKNIAGKVYQYAVIDDGQGYSEFIFTTYANYIDTSAEIVQMYSSERTYKAIKELSNTLRHNTELLNKGEITETAYIEAGLWVSLEAMIKLMAAYLTMNVRDEYSELTQAVAQLAFEYGRYNLYKKEQAILERYIQNQYKLDEQLERDYEAYLEEVKERADGFQKLIDQAFSPDFRETLLQSAELARTAGVKEEEILTSVEEIDEFFM